jgi:hypothetical protein
MTKLLVLLECGHQIQWSEEPETPYASLPFIGGTAWCDECESDEEITDVTPDVVYIGMEYEEYKFYNAKNGFERYRVVKPEESQPSLIAWSDAPFIVEFYDEVQERWIPFCGVESDDENIVISTIKEVN